jgi:hypothetical protein
MLSKPEPSTCSTSCNPMLTWVTVRKAGAAGSVQAGTPTARSADLWEERAPQA